MTLTTSDKWIIGAVLAVYALSAVVSTPHLAQWFATYNGSLPALLPWLIAACVELFVFVFSLISRLKPRTEVGAWAFWGSTLMLLVVVIGNWRSMWLTVQAVPYSLEFWLVLLASSVFGLVGLVAGKVIGGVLLDNAERLMLNAERPSMDEPQTVQPVQGVQVEHAVQHSTTITQTVRQSFSLSERSKQVLGRLDGPSSLSSLSRETGLAKSSTAAELKRLEGAGLVQRLDDLWTATEQGRAALHG
jgi:hypothetical protein